MQFITIFVNAREQSDNIRAIYYWAVNSTLISMLLNKKLSKYIRQKLYRMIQAMRGTQKIKSITTYQFSVRCDSFKERKNWQAKTDWQGRHLFLIIIPKFIGHNKIFFYF